MPDSGKVQNIGILGGTFDPVHKGHLTIATQLLSGFKLDLILFIPAAWPPHKRKPAVSYSHRVAMLDTALGDEKQMSISLLESERSQPSYTIDTLRELKQRLGPQNFNFNIGADAFSELHLWYEFKEVLQEVNLIVVSRPGFTFEYFVKYLERLPGQYRQDYTGKKWFGLQGKTISFFPESQETVSSTEIRNFLQRDKAVDHLLPPKVYQYIKKYNLYQG